MTSSKPRGWRTARVRRARQLVVRANQLEKDVAAGAARPARKILQAQALRNRAAAELEAIDRLADRPVEARTGTGGRPGRTQRRRRRLIAAWTRWSRS